MFGYLRAKRTNLAKNTSEAHNGSRTPMQRILAALGNRVKPDDTERADLPVGLIHEGILPVSGSVLIATGRVVSRESVDKDLDKVLGR